MKWKLPRYGFTWVYVAIWAIPALTLDVGVIVRWHPGDWPALVIGLFFTLLLAACIYADGKEQYYRDLDVQQPERVWRRKAAYLEREIKTRRAELKQLRLRIRIDADELERMKRLLKRDP